MALLPASERIRYRLVAAERRYHANDNISAFVRAGEMEELKAEVQAKMQEVLRVLDPEAQVLLRVAREDALVDVEEGRGEVGPEELGLLEGAQAGLVVP